MFEFLSSPELQGALANFVILFVGLFTTALLANGSLWIRSHVTMDKLALLKEFSALAVKAAEQGELAGILRDKKASAMAAVQGLLDAAKVTGFDVNDVEAAIEAAVLEFNQREGYFMKTMLSDGEDYPDEPQPDGDPVEITGEPV